MHNYSLATDKVSEYFHGLTYFDTCVNFIKDGGSSNSNFFEEEYVRKTAMKGAFYAFSYNIEACKSYVTTAAYISSTSSLGIFSLIKLWFLIDDAVGNSAQQWSISLLENHSTKMYP